MDTELLPPHARAGQIGRDETEAFLRATMGEGALSHGWIIAGRKGAGKATLAYRVARGVLSPKSLINDHSFEVSPDSQVFKLVAGRAHPDLFVAERMWNEKISKYQSEITIETIRRLTMFLNHTAALGGYRVAIIDIADDLNRNAANALLKALEEPPSKTLLLLLSEAPGRLIATIRSRCRRLTLRAVDQSEIIPLMEREGAASGEEARRVAAHANGRPGYALTLAAGEGGEAIKLAEAFLDASRRRGDISKISAALTVKAGEAKWEIFRAAVMNNLSEAARISARGEAAPAPLGGIQPPALLDGWEKLSTLTAHGEAVNLDRGQLIVAMAHDLRTALANA